MSFSGPTLEIRLENGKGDGDRSSSKIVVTAKETKESTTPAADRIQPGDILLSVDGRAFENAAEAFYFLYMLPKDKAVIARFCRLVFFDIPIHETRLGLVISEQPATRLEVANVQDPSLGVGVGDVISQIEGQPPTTEADALLGGFAVPPRSTTSDSV